MWRARVIAALIGSVFAGIACSDSVGEPEISQPDFATIAWCIEHPEQCTSDPNPSAPGIWLGYGIDYDFCVGEFINDLDQDGVHDDCEYLVALAFRPLMKYYSLDGYMGREPRWAARSVLGGISVFYAFSYYIDGGSTVSCPIFCSPHLGDSEYILLDVVYIPSTEHWELRNAAYSQHGTPQLFFGLFGKSWPSMLEYPAKFGGYPAVYIARQKHANYKDEADCDSGGTANSDDCIINREVRLDVLSNANLGSRDVSFIDCVFSAVPSQNPGTECYWTDIGYFAGWQDLGNASISGTADPYLDFLSAHGF